MQLRYAFLAAVFASLGPSGIAIAQEDPAAQAVQDEQIDRTLGMLGTPHGLSLVLLPRELPGTRGPLPFDQEPPAAQNDFSEVTADVRPCPRRGSPGNC